MKTVIVVTRYGVSRHLADLSRQQDDGRFLTLCHGTSAWTLGSWRRNPDHSQLSPEQMEALPICVTCTAAAERESRPEPVTDQSQTKVCVTCHDTVTYDGVVWVDSTGGDVCMDNDGVDGPHRVTDQSQTWLAVIHRKTVGGVDKIVGPFATEERAMHWLESMQKPGSVHQLVVLS